MLAGVIVGIELGLGFEVVLLGLLAVVFRPPEKA
jgi:hypothetical protein